MNADLIAHGRMKSKTYAKAFPNGEHDGASVPIIDALCDALEAAERALALREEFIAAQTERIRANRVRYEAAELAIVRKDAEIARLLSTNADLTSVPS